MLRIFKILTLLLAFVFTIGGMQSCKTKSGHNKYREAKVRPSEKQMRADKRAIAKGNKNYKRHLLMNRKRLLGSKRDPKAPKN